MSALQPDSKLFMLEARARKLQSAEDEIVGLCESVVDGVLARVDNGFEAENIDPAQALQLLAQIHAARKIMRRFRKAVRDGIAASEEIHATRT